MPPRRAPPRRRWIRKGRNDGRHVIGLLLPPSTVAFEAFAAEPGQIRFRATRTYSGAPSNCPQQVHDRPVSRVPRASCPGPSRRADPVRHSWGASVASRHRRQHHRCQRRLSGGRRGPSSEVAGIGIDSEPNERVPNAVAAMVSLRQERSGLRRLASRHPGVHWEGLLHRAIPGDL